LKFYSSYVIIIVLECAASLSYIAPQGSSLSSSKTSIGDTLTSDRLPPLHPLEIDRWMHAHRVYRQVVALVVLLGLAGLITWLNFNIHHNVTANVALLVIALLLIVLPIRIGWYWGSRAYWSLQRMSVFQSALAFLVIFGASTLYFDHLTMRQLLGLLILVLLLGALLVLIKYTTSPRACRAEIEAAKDGFFDK